MGELTGQKGGGGTPGLEYAAPWAEQHFWAFFCLNQVTSPSQDGLHPRALLLPQVASFSLVLFLLIRPSDVFCQLCSLKAAADVLQQDLIHSMQLTPLFLLSAVAVRTIRQRHLSRAYAHPGFVSDHQRNLNLHHKE